MATQLIRVRKKPHFGLPWLAVLLGIGTFLFAVQGVGAVFATPEAHLEIVVLGQHDFNISQQSVDAVVREPIKTWKPLRMLVTPRHLRLDEKMGREDGGADVILSTTIANAVGTSTQEHRYRGAGVYPADGENFENYQSALQIYRAYESNVTLGHGPTAVAAAAQRAAKLLDTGPIQSPLFWLTGTVTGLGLTTLTLAFSLSKRKRRELIFRRLTTAQHLLAGVVLSLDALEVTYLATPKDQRTVGFTSTWRRIRNVSLTLAQSEDGLMDAVYNVKSALKPRTSVRVKKFQTAVQQLDTQAEALMGAGAVLGLLSGRQGILDRLAEPMVFATRELLARLSDRPQGTVSAKRVRRLEDALAALLRSLASDQVTAGSIQAWRSVEFELEKSVRAINRSLRRHRQARANPPSKTAAKEDFSALRSGLGLSPIGSEKTLTALREANVAAHALLGPLPSTTEAPGQAPRNFSWRPLMPKLSSPTSWLLRSLVMMLIAFSVSGICIAQIAPRDGNELTGTLPLRSLAINGDTTDVDESEIRRYFEDKLTQSLDITIAVRSAAEYLGIQDQRPPDEFGVINDQDPRILVDALWRVKSEFPEIIDPATGEILAGQVIIPAWKYGEDTFAVPTLITAVETSGDFNSMGGHLWDFGSYYFSDTVERTVGATINDLSLELRANGHVEPELNGFLLFVLLGLSIGLSLITFAMGISYGGIMSMKIGLFGRNAATLRRIRTQLNELVLGLDDARLNTVVMLGTAPKDMSAESDQRIFESALAMAWRMADDLQARPISQRLDPGYVAEIAKLKQSVQTLVLRDADVHRRTQSLLDAALGRNLKRNT